MAHADRNSSAQHVHQIVLGSYGAGHLGDVLCSTPLVRQYAAEFGSAFIQDNPLSRAVFANNPYLSGFARTAGVPLQAVARGYGHISQRLSQTFGLPIELRPKPELFFRADELRWARSIRCRCGKFRPICIVSPRAMTDRKHLSGVDWQAVGRVLGRRYTLFQPVLSGPRTYQRQGGTIYTGQPWHREPILPNARIFRDLPLRRYFALFTVADLFIGGPAGGSHVAAALDVPSIIVLWKSLCQRIRFPVSGSLDNVEHFLYPHHWLVGFEELETPALAEASLRPLLGEIARHGRAGRPAAMPNHPINPSGLSPSVPPLVVRTPDGRLRRIPASYAPRPPAVEFGCQTDGQVI